MLCAGSCGDGADDASARRYHVDVHSHGRPEQVRVRHVSLELRLDFTTRVVSGVARMQLERAAGSSSLILDSQDLEIEAVTGADGQPREHELAAPEAIMGSRLVIELAPGDQEVAISYRTSPDAAALQWLLPEQTASGAQPFLYTQGQAILTRSWIPIQDSPGGRVTYDALVTAPAAMQVVMSADQREQLAPGRFRFEMGKPIPPYLIALACGDLARRDLSDRCAVYADPTIVDSAATEFEDVESMIAACEQKFGPYRWGRYDVLVLPPAFPFGGMENPTLTFATPTILAGDKSLVALIAHELAHSWSGNLVTNATWRDFWLNEGFTVYLEQRIMELVYGSDRADMEILIGLQGLDEELRHLPDEEQVLHINLDGRNPDDGMTAVPYDKGAAFLRRIEHVVGRPRFDAFLASYFDAHAYRSIETGEFVEFLEDELLRGDQEWAQAIDVATWLNAPGIPEAAVRPRSEAFNRVGDFRQRWLAGDAEVSETADWITHQWLYFLAEMPSLSADQLTRLDEDFSLTGSGNSEVLTAWLRLAISHEHRAAYPRVEEFLMSVGRRKFLKPLYEGLVKTPGGAEFAKRVYARARPRYHAISRRTLDVILDYQG